VVPTTTSEVEQIRTFEVFIENTSENGLEKPSKVLCNYPHTVYKKLRLVGKKRLGSSQSGNNGKSERIPKNNS